MRTITSGETRISAIDVQHVFEKYNCPVKGGNICNDLWSCDAIVPFILNNQFFVYIAK